MNTKEKFTLYDYQEDAILSVLYYLKDNDRCCVSLATGSGKTVIFSELVNRIEGSILICVHREELVHQTSEALQVDHKLIVPSKYEFGDVTIAMVQTLKNRIKKGAIDINDFDYIIIDECHRGEFINILDRYNRKVIGFTATPNYEKKESLFICSNCGNETDEKCCNKKPEKYHRKIPLSNYYHKLIRGIEIGELIEKDYLVQDDNYVLDIDTSRLVYDEFKGEYTEESISLVFGSKEAIRNTVNTYKELALDKKTIIFNPNTLVNKLLYDAMKKEGINVKMYDSKNSSENRKDLIEWFKNTSNAVLLNVHIFTTGFNCTDVEVIFLNKKTQSLNLYIQMVGRGGRKTKKIFKPSFRVIDMGNNNKDFGNWSDKREWNKYFYDNALKKTGSGKEPAVRECHNCEAVVAANSLICPFCNTEKIYNEQGVSGLPKKNGKIVISKPEKIIEYCEQNNLDTLAARKIVYNLISDMFIDTSYETYIESYSSGELYDRTWTFAKPYYFAIQNSKLEGNKVCKLDNFTNKIIKSIQKGYDKRK